MRLKNFFFLLILCFTGECFSQSVSNSVFSFYNCNLLPAQVVTSIDEDTVSQQSYYSILCPHFIEKLPTSTYPISYLTVSYNGLNGTSYGIQTRYHNSKLFYADENSLYAYGTNTNTPIWTYTVPNTGYNIVDFLFKSDTVVIVSQDITSNGCSIINLVNLNTGAPIGFPNYDICNGGSSDYILGCIKTCNISSNKLLLGGKFMAYNSLGNLVDSNFTSINLSNGLLQSLNTKINDTVKDIEVRSGKIHLVGSFTKVGLLNRGHYAELNSSFITQNTNINFIGEVSQLELYDKYIFALGKYSAVNSTVVNSTNNYTICAINTVNNTIRNFNISTPGGPNTYKYLFKIIQNKLHVSCKENSTSYNRYILSPRLQSNLISSSTPTICIPSSSNLFSILPALYADGYDWSYNGTGATLTFTNNIANLAFSSSATSGVLKVWAFSNIGGNSDTLSLNVNVFPKPNISCTLPISNISCFNPKVPILSSSSTPSVSYSWSGPSGYVSFNKNDSTGYLKNGKYIVTVTNTVTGCTKKDSILVGIDTIRPIVSLPSLPVDLYCNPDSSQLNGSSPSPNPSIWWHIANSGIKHVNPYFTKNIGNYYMVVQNMTNGCKDSSVFVVGDKRVLPNVKITSHTYVSPIIPIDTITCTKTTINVVAASDTLNTVFNWKSIPGNIISPNPLNISNQGNYKLLVSRTDNGCSDSSLIVYIAQNITHPNISITTPIASINCSSSTATLNANTSFSTTTLNWTGPSSFNSPNPAVTSVQGKYYINAINSENGCTKKDSVTVNYSPILIVHTNNDTTVCKNSSVNLQANITGTLTGITYAWSNSTVGQSINVNPNITTQFIVTANSTNGCSGKDTVVVTIPSDIQDSIVTTKSCNGATVGSITIYAKGGVAPYLYSFNGGAFTTQTTYTNLPYATYPIIIKDALGCTKNISGSINQNSSLPVPVFIASTQNTKGDTIVLVDLTVPKADSVQWSLPLAASIVGGDMFNPLVYFADTGNFVITLTAFYADCDISTTKNIHVGPVDTTVASANNNNGIKSITLYPNPNTGLFTADIEFYKKQNSSIQIFDASSVKYFQQNFLNTDFISLPVDVTNLSNGTYIFKVIGEYNAKHVNFVISK